MEEILSIVALSRIQGVPYAVKRSIMEQSPSPETFFQGKGHLDPHYRERLLGFRDWKALEKELCRIAKMGARVTTIKDPGYPPLLKHIADPPLVIFQKGPLAPTERTIAIVGARKASFEGIRLAEEIGSTLSSAGITVVSGLARGIDSASHRGALGGQGKTVAVLGCGLDICYPPENRSLFDRIADQGLLLTEYGLAEKPLPFHFPERNRIIAGLSRAVLVIEASEKSGALITARLALDYGRDVMAIPGDIFADGHRGTNALIKQGARLVDRAEDIIECSFPGFTVPKTDTLDMNDNESYIYGFVGKTRTHVDDIIAGSGTGAKEVMATLTGLEIAGAVVQLPGGYFVRK